VQSFKYVGGGNGAAKVLIHVRDSVMSPFAFPLCILQGTADPFKTTNRRRLPTAFVRAASIGQTVNQCRVGIVALLATGASNTSGYDPI
jgi:hypothetical protein